MWKKQRHKEILDILDKKNSLSLSALAQKFHLSEITIRKDVRELAERGLLIRKYGLVSKAAPDQSVFKYTGTSVDSRQMEDYSIKEQLAQSVFPRILKVSSIFIDDSSTVSHLLPLLKNLSGLTVITPSILAINYLSDVPNIHTIGLGGTVCTIHKSFIGPVAAEQMVQHKVDIAFFGCYGVSPERGCLENFFSITDVKKQAAVCSKENIVLISGSKWARSEGVPSLSWEDVSLVVSDQLPKSPEFLAVLAQKKVQIQISGP